MQRHPFGSKRSRRSVVDRAMKRVLVAGIVAIPVFLAVAVLTWILASLHRLSMGGDIFGDNRQRD